MNWFDTDCIKTELESLIWKKQIQFFLNLSIYIDYIVYILLDRYIISNCVKKKRIEYWGNVVEAIYGVLMSSKKM